MRLGSFGAGFIATLISISALFACCHALAGSVDDVITSLEHDWQAASFHTPEKHKLAAFKELAAKARQFNIANPEKVGLMVWEAIILCGYADQIHGLASLQKVETAREILEHAEKIKPDELSSVIYTLLGELYLKVPEWPISFGNKAKAREYLDKAIKIDPDGIEPNYLYGVYFLENGEYSQAEYRLEKALHAPPRLNKEESDQERRVEIQMLLGKIKQYYSSR